MEQRVPYVTAQARMCSKEQEVKLEGGSCEVKTGDMFDDFVSSLYIF